jgi:hypothetical protein
MYMVKKDGPQKYNSRPINVAESEQMMGYMNGYVEIPSNLCMSFSMSISTNLI